MLRHRLTRTEPGIGPGPQSTRAAGLFFTILALVLGGCALQTSTTSIYAGSATPTHPAFASGGIYVNPALGFSLTVPADWMVQQHYGLRQLPHTATVTLVNKQNTSDQISVDVTEGECCRRRVCLPRNGHFANWRLSSVCRRQLRSRGARPRPLSDSRVSRRR